LRETYGFFISSEKVLYFYYDLYLNYIVRIKKSCIFAPA
jgi:hypothetical protein